MHVRILARMHEKGAHILNKRDAQELLLAHQCRPIGIKTDMIVHDVLATLDVIIERATLGTILYRKKSFLITRRFSTLLHNVWCTTQLCTSHPSIRIVLLSRYVNIYDTMAPMSVFKLKGSEGNGTVGACSARNLAETARIGDSNCCYGCGD